MPAIARLHRATRAQQMVALLLLGILFIGTGIGLRDPWPSDEPRFAMMARDMVESGQWLFPTRAGELYPDKPPLFMWTQAVVYQVTGSLRVATLLPSLIAGLMILLLVYDMGRRLWNRRVGLTAGLALLAMPQFVLETRAGQLDAMVTAWIALGMYGFLRYLLVDQHRGWLIAGFAACGFGIITKGVGFLPLLVFVAALATRHQTSRVGLSNLSLGLLAMLAAIALWLAPMLVVVAASGDPSLEAYRDNILWQQTAQRYAAPTHHFKPPWYFPAEVIPSLWLPWFLLLPWAIPAWHRRIRRGDSRFRLLLGWVALVVLFFSISPAKRGVYILPALPWATLALAPLLTGLLRRLWVRRLSIAVCGLFTLVGLGAAAYLGLIQPDRSADLVTRYGIALEYPLLIAGIGAATGTVLALRAAPGRGVLTMMLSWWLALGLWIYPRLDPVKSGAALMLRIEQELRPGQPLALVEWREQTLLQARRPASTFGFLTEPEEQWNRAIEWMGAHPDGAVLALTVDPRCANNARITSLGIAHRREWFLIEPAADGPACR